MRPPIITMIIAVIPAGVCAVLAGELVYAAITPCGADCLPRTSGSLAAIGGVVLMVLVAGAGFLSTAFTSIRLTDDEVVVQNLLWRRRSVPLVQVSTVDTFWGMVIHLANGDDLWWKGDAGPDWLALFGHVRRSRLVADEIERRAWLARERTAGLTPQRPDA